MEIPRRGFLGVIAGGIGGWVAIDMQRDWRASQSLLQSLPVMEKVISKTESKGEVPKAKGEEEVSVPPEGYSLLDFEITGSEFEYTLDMEAGAVETWVSKPKEGEESTSFSSNVGCTNDATAGETSTVRCTLEEGKYKLVFKSTSKEESKINLVLRVL